MKEYQVKLINKRGNKCLLLSADLADKFPTGCALVLKIKGQQKMILVPISADWMKGTTVSHIKKRKTAFFSKYKYRMELVVPEPASVLYTYGIDPEKEEYTFKAVAENQKDEYEKEKTVFTLQS